MQYFLASRLLGLEMFKHLHAHPTFDGGVPVILDGIVGAIGKHLGDYRPLVAISA